MNSCLDNEIMLSWNDDMLKHEAMPVFCDSLKWLQKLKLKKNKAFKISRYQHFSGKSDSSSFQFPRDKNELFAIAQCQVFLV